MHIISVTDFPLFCSNSARKCLILPAECSPQKSLIFLEILPAEFSQAYRAVSLFSPFARSPARATRGSRLEYRARGFAVRLRVVSNFGDGDCGADEIHTRARNFEETRREGCLFFRRSLRVASPRSFARACVFRPRHNRHRQN